LIFEYFWKICRDNSSFIKYEENNGYFRERFMYVCDISLNFIELELFQTEVVEKIKTKFYVQ
jgi:hypothetical protein